MIRLNPGMMARYDIADCRPPRVNAVQFGMGEALMGVADRLLEGAGIACVEAGEAGFAARLAEQGGLYTVIVRGYDGDAPVRREEVVQRVLRAVDPLRDPAALAALAADPEILFGIVDDTPAAAALAEAFCRARRGAGLPALPCLCLGDCGGREGWHPMLADGLALRSEPDEAAKLCADMNYLDDMLYLAEPHARLVVRLPEGLRGRLPLGGALCVDDRGWETELRLMREVFDAGVFLMAAPGWLNGCDTMVDCMRHERLRRFIGRAFTDEIMPALGDVDRELLEARVIECFNRCENPLNRNRLLRCARNLLGRFLAGPAQVMRRYARDNFEPPRGLAFALAATVMLYAGARRNPETGLYEVARGRQTQVLRDDPAALARFAALSHDMPPESLAYAALSDRELWGGEDLRDIDGLEERLALDIAAMQREPGVIPE